MEVKTEIAKPRIRIMQDRSHRTAGGFGKAYFTTYERHSGIFNAEGSHQVAE